MASRRIKGEGSIRRRANGTWEARVTYYDDDGKQRQKSAYAQTQREVREKLRTLQDQMDSPDYHEPSDIKLSDWLDTWMKEYKHHSTMYN